MIKALSRIKSRQDEQELQDSEVNTAFHALHWKDIAGMRDKLIHDYFGIDLDDVWDTVEKDIPI
ncbi:MAG: DUF86 domain-containing protein [Candidatus Methanoperedens sp.]